MKSSLTKILASLFLFALVLGAFALVLPTPTHAAFADAKDYTLLAPLPGVANAAGKTDFVTYMKGIFKLLISLSAVIAVVMITFEGFKLVTSVAEGARTAAKEKIQEILWGLVLILASYLILYTVNPKLTKIEFDVKNVCSGGADCSMFNGSSAFLQDSLTAAALEEKAAAQQAKDIEIAKQLNAEYNGKLAPLTQEMNALGDCSTADDYDECQTQKADVQTRIDALKAETDTAASLAYLHNRQLQAINDIKPPIQESDLNYKLQQAKYEVSQMNKRARVDYQKLLAQGKPEAAAQVLAEANKISQEMSAAIARRQRCPQGDTNYETVAAGEYASIVSTPCK